MSTIASFNVLEQWSSPIASQEGFHIETMRPEDVKTAIEWAAAEGWNPGLVDAECFYAADPRGFFIGRLHDETVAVASVVAYDAAFAFFGLFIVKEMHRGRGFGRRMTAHALAHAKSACIGADGVVAMLPKYETIGFREAYRQFRFAGVCEGERGENVVDLASVPFAEVAQFDRRYFPAPRPKFLERWIAQPGGVALGHVENGRLDGYGVMRPCVEGWKVGPLFAESPAIAETLFSSFCAESDDEPVILDVPEINTEALALVDRRPMSRVFETARIYIGDPPSFDTSGVYGVTTFELG